MHKLLTTIAIAFLAIAAKADIYRCEGRCVRTAESVSSKTGAKRLIYEEMGCGKIHRDGASPQEALRNLQAECTKRSGNRLLRSFTSVEASAQMTSTSDLEPGTLIIAAGTAKEATTNECRLLSSSGSGGGTGDTESRQ